MSLALLALVYFALRHSVATVALLLAAWILEAALRDSVELSVALSTFRIAPLDVMSVVLVAIGTARALSQSVRGMGLGLALLLLSLLSVHVARGVADFGLQVGYNGGREWLYLIAALLFTATVPGGWPPRVWKVLIVAGTLLAVIAVPYFFVDGLGSATEQIYRGDELVTSRPIAATGTLVILQAAVLALALGWPSRQTAAYLAIGAGTVTLLLQHRTLWAAGLLVGLLGFIWWLARRSQRDTALTAIAVLIVFLPIAAWGFSQTGPLVESVSEVDRSDSTLVFRTTSWGQLISSHDSVSDLVAGNPSGTDLSRTIAGANVDVSPHNGFLDAYLRFGLPGVLVLSWLGLLLWYHRTSIAAGTALTTEAVGLLIVTQFVFSITYSLDVIQGVIAGVFVSGLILAEPVRGASRFPASAPAREYAVR